MVKSTKQQMNTRVSFKLTLAAAWLLLGLVFPTISDAQAVDRAATLESAEQQLWVAEKMDSILQVLESLAAADKAAGRRDDLTRRIHYVLGMSRIANSDSEGAFLSWQRSIDLAQELYGPENYEQMEALSMLASAQMGVGFHNASAVNLRRLATLHERAEAPDTLKWIGTLYRLGLYAENYGDVDLAESAILTAMNLTDTYNRPKSYYHTEIYILACRYFTHKENNELGLEYGLEAKRRIMSAVRNDNIGTLYLNLITLYNRLDRFEEAGKIEKELLLLIRNMDGFRKEMLVIYLAENYLARGKTYQAFKLIENQSDISEDLDPANRFKLNYVRGQLYIQLGHYEEALHYINLAMATITRQNNAPPESTAFPSAEQLKDHILLGTNAYRARAEAHTKAGQPLAAQRNYAAVFDLIDTHRGRITAEGSRRFVSQSLFPMVRKAFASHLESYRSTGDKAHLWALFNIAERSRGFSLIRNLRDGARDRSVAEDQLRWQIAELERADPTMDVNEDLNSFRVRLEELRAAGDHQQFYYRDFDQPQLDRLGLGTGKSGLVYYLGSEQAYLFTLTDANGPKMWELGKSDSLRQLVMDYRRILEVSRYQGKSLRSVENQRALDESLARTAHDLRRSILPDALLAQISEDSALVIVPDGVLHYLPFAAIPLKGGDFLSSRYVLQHAFSLQQLRFLDLPRDFEYNRNLVAFAPSFAGTLDPLALNQFRLSRGLLPQDTSSLPGLAPLAHNREEVDAIAAYFPNSRTFGGEEATRSRFLEEASGARIVHLSSHGVADAKHPNFSFLAFSQPEEWLNPSELLYFNDLSALPLRAELVVLSACETSLGRLAPGETVLSLASAFTAAGARSTLTSLWPVDDEATRLLMEAFYANIAKGECRTKALAMAQHDMQTGKFSHPYYWSGFMLTGDAGPIEMAGPSMISDRYIVAGSLVTLLFIMLGSILAFRRPTNTLD